MNELLQKHGCTNVFSVPEGLKELMSDITREVLREQPTNIFEFIANYLSVLLVTREHGVLALRILDDLCDCKPSVSEHLMQLGMERMQADSLAQVIKEEIEGFEPIEGREKVKEQQIMKKILMRSVLDEDLAARVCQVARNAYRDYWYRKKILEQSMKVQPDEPWEIAAEHTLELYKKTKPSFSELTRATEKIQAAYRGYYVRKNLLNHLKPKRKKQGPKVELPGPPLDIAESREIDLGPVIDIKVREDNMHAMFEDYAGKQLGLRYDTMKTITHVDDDEFLQEVGSRSSRTVSQGKGSVAGMQPRELQSSKSLGGVVQSSKSIGRDLQSSKSVGGVSTAGGLSMTGVEAKSRMSRTEELEIGARQSRVTSQIPMSARQSRIPSIMDADQLHKISFAERPPDVIPDEDEGDVKEIMEPQEVQEVHEDLGIPVEPAEGMDQEIPEDIPDDRTEGDGESAPIDSVPLSGPNTADNTDVEDAGGTDFGGDTPGEDEAE